MNVLAIDTASACSVAVARDGRISALQHRDIARGHAEALMPMIEAALAGAGLDYEDIDLIAAAIGPGSFTGLRTGLATARGLALALGRPTLGVSSLAAVAYAAVSVIPILVALETKRDTIYFQVFSPAGEPLTEPLLRRPDEIAALLPPGPIAIAGDAAHRLRGTLVAEFHDTIVSGNAAVIAALASAWRPNSAAIEPLRPLYLAPPLAKPQPGGGAVRP